MSSTAGAARPPGAAPRPPGRPRSTRVDDAISQAVLEMLAEGTPSEALSMEAIATRAGVGKATIYRRWPHKDALLVDVVGSIKEPLPQPDGVSVRDDLIMLTRRAWRPHSSMSSRILPCLIPELQRNERLGELYRTMTEQRRGVIRDVIVRGMRLGELRAGLDPDLVARLITAPAVASSLFGTQRSDDEIDRQAVELVDLLLHGMSTDQDVPPGR
jgi:AcrR family transcriptional regulator